MSSKLLKTTTILFLSAMAIQPSYASLSFDELEAFGKSSTAAVKAVAKEAVDSAVDGTLDTLNAGLGGGADDLKAKIAHLPSTSALDDLTAEIARVDATPAQTLKAGLDAVKTKLGVGGGTTVLADAGALAARANPGGLPGQTLDAAVTAALAAAGAPDVRARIGNAGNVDNLTDINLEIARMSAVGATTMAAATTAQQASIKTAAAAPGDVTLTLLNAQVALLDAGGVLQTGVTNARASVGPVVGTVNADLAAQVALLDAAPALATGIGNTRARVGAVVGTVNADLTTQVGRLDVGNVLTTGLNTTRGYVGATVGTINADFLTQLGRLNTMLTTAGAAPGQTGGVLYAGSATDLTAMLTFVLTRSLSA